jgi:hypothetical protein
LGVGSVVGVLMCQRCVFPIRVDTVAAAVAVNIMENKMVVQGVARVLGCGNRMGNGGGGKRTYQVWHLPGVPQVRP